MKRGTPTTETETMMSQSTKWTGVLFIATLLILWLPWETCAQLVYQYTPDERSAFEQSDREIKAGLCGYGSYSLYAEANGRCGLVWRGLYAVHSGERSFHRWYYRQRYLKGVLLVGVMYGQARKTAGQYKAREYSTWIHQGQALYQTSLLWYLYSQRVTAWEAVGFTMVSDAVLNLAIAHVFDYKRESGSWDIQLLGKERTVPAIFAGRRWEQLAVGAALIVIPNLIGALNRQPVPDRVSLRLSPVGAAVSVKL